jgi:3D (Asp-Asp-Asp) domain-containing protein
MCIRVVVLFSFFLSLVTLGACVQSRSQAQSKVPSGYSLLGDFAPTFYRILDESSGEWPEEERTESLLTVDGKLIERVTPSFKRHLDIEGSARLRDGRVVNFLEKTDDGWRYMIVSDAPYGLAATGDKLIPYRTLAVDPKVIAQGAVLFIPSLVGVRLPSGEIHDGYFFAHDTGQGITGRRIDVFVGFEHDEDNTLTRSGQIEDMKPVSIYRVDEATAARVTERFRKQFERPETR